MADTDSLAQQCTESFHKGEFGACLDSLDSLRKRSGTNSPAIDANKSLVKFVKSFWTDVDEFSKCVANISYTSNEIRNSGQLYFLYNQAILSFHNGHYIRSSELLAQIFNSSNVPESVLIHSVLLVAEINLRLRQPEKVLKTLAKCDAFVNESSKTPTSSSIDKSNVDLLKCRIFLAKIRACLMLRNFKACQKEAKKLTNSPFCTVWMSAMFRAQHDYQRLTPHKSLKSVLNAKEQNGEKSTDERFSSTGVCFPAVEYNALGCLYFQMNKPNLSLVYFRKAVEEYSRVANAKSAIFCHNSTFRLYLLQNYGAALLHVGQPVPAFDCLIEVVKVVNNNPRLWLRLAECCILSYKPNNEVDVEMVHCKRNIVKDVIGVGPHRKIVLNAASFGHRKSSNHSQEQGAMPTLSLEFAYVCLKNALATLPNVKSEKSQSETSEGNAAQQLTFPAPLSSPFSLNEVFRIRCSILCATAYVCLSVGEIHLALESAVELIGQNGLSFAHKCLAHFYAAEASILLERPLDAVNYLRVTIDADQPFNIAEQWVGAEPTLSEYYPKNVDTFKVMLYYNLALTFTLQDEFDKAIQVISSIGENVEMPVQVTMLGLYIQLKSGQIETARQNIIKMFPNLQLPVSFAVN